MIHIDTDYERQVQQDIVRQIGKFNILSISGGRVLTRGLRVTLPVSNGYSVRVEYDEGMDTYTVSRVFKRGNKEWIKGQRTNVYCDELAGIAYLAGMFRSYSAEEWTS